MKERELWYVLEFGGGGREKRGEKKERKEEIVWMKKV